MSLSLEYLLRPSTIREGKAPALFMFHGYGSNESDFFSFATQLPEEMTVLSVRAPHPLELSGYAWYAIHFDAEQGKWNDEAQARESRDRVASFIDEACEAYSLDTENITLMGFSQGAILSYAIALSFPEKVKNVIALSGYLNANLLQEGYTNKDHSTLNIYASHGQVDQVIPLEWAQKTPDFLKTLHITPTYEEFPVGHEISPENFYSFREWLVNHL